MFSFRRTRRAPPPKPPHRQVVLAPSVWHEVTGALQSTLSRGHEGILYFGGFIHEHRTLALMVLIPDADTTRGSFTVSAASMAKVTNRACALNLEIVGQLHSHPGEAYHSDGDVDGATLVRPGYVSIVVPVYGRLLPSVEGSCLFSWECTTGFVERDVRSIALIPSRADCR